MVRHVANTEGLPGFFRGFWPVMATELPMGAISWATYEFVKKKLGTGEQRTRKRDTFLLNILCLAFPNYRDGHLVHFCAGLTAGAVAPTVMAPLEISKTRLQVKRKKELISQKEKILPSLFI